MATSINTNISAYFAQTNLRSASASSQNSIARLSSGDRIINASDDVAGLSVGTAIRTAVNTLKTALANSQQASSLLQVADGGLASITEILQRQKSLAVQATSGSLSATERGFLNQEFQNLATEIDRLVSNTKFNKVTLLDGSLSGTEGNTLVQLDATAATITGAGSAAASTNVMEFFLDGATIQGNAAGNMQFLESDLTTAYADDDFALLPPSIVGNVGSFTISNAVYNVSADVSVTIGGVTLTGTFADGDTNVIVSNGNTHLQVFLNGGATNITNQTDVQNLSEDFNSTFNGAKLQGVYNVAGFAPDGTLLDGADVTPLLRVSDTSDMTIRNFDMVQAATGANILSVDIGGRQFLATAVADAPGGTALQFVNGDDVMFLDLTNMTATPDIFASTTDRANFIAALNQAFTNAQGAISFQTGSASDDNISVSIRSVATKDLYGNASLEITSAASAQISGDAIDVALNYVTSVRADVGAMQSRFNYASATLETSIQNQDAARGTFLDADISAEATTFSSNQVLMQASISVLAQANQLPQNLLKLIG